MEPNWFDKSTKAQHESLCKIAKALWLRGHRSSRVRNKLLQSLDIVKLAPLEIDDPVACDSGPRFFEPSYGDEHLTHAIGADDPEYVTGIIETGQRWERVWRPEFAPFDPDDSVWLGPCPEDLPKSRFVWFARCLDRMQQDHLDRDDCGWWADEDEQKRHESRT